MKVGAVIRLLESDGWQFVTSKGSHKQFRHLTKAGRLTIAGHPSDDLASGTLGSILEQAGLRK